MSSRGVLKLPISFETSVWKAKRARGRGREGRQKATKAERQNEKKNEEEKEERYNVV